MPFQPILPPTPVETNLAGKTVIVTGANAGLGLETSRQYLQLGVSHLILAVRSTTRGQQAAKDLKADPTVLQVNPDARVDVWELDMEDWSSALAFVNKAKAELQSLDVLMLSAGMTSLDYVRSKAGHERNIQVNCWTNFFLSLELLPLLQSTRALRGRPSHLSIVGSDMHRSHSLAKRGLKPTESVYGRFDDKSQYTSLGRYQDTKLVVAAFVQQLAKRTNSKDVIVNSFCPGMVRTGLEKHMPWYIKGLTSVAKRLLARSVEEGARTYIHASVEAGPESHGQYISSNKIAPAAPWLDEPAGQDFSDKLWTETLAEATRVDPSFNFA